MKFNTTKSLFVAMAFVLMCLWAFNTVHTGDAHVALTKEAQAAITPAKALEMLKQGNKRFVSSKLKKRDILAQVKQTSKGQFPFAALVSCIDSRIPPELVFDQGIGDIFVALVAGNFVNDDILGSLEFATKLAGAKLIVVMGHTDCGAVQGACDKAQLGLLTATLANINPAVNAVRGTTRPEPRRTISLSRPSRK